MSIAEIQAMNTTEQLQTMEFLWDALCHGQKEIASPHWHEAELSERRKKIEAGKAKFYTLAAIKERFRK